MSKHPLIGCWIVGEVKWQDGIANPIIAKTKTKARQYAEFRLAKAEHDWTHNKDAAERFNQRHDPARKRMTLDQYAEYITNRHGMNTLSVEYRNYLRLRNGYTLIGPKGETIHITKPSQKARQDRSITERRRAGELKAIGKTLAASIRQHKSRMAQGR